MIDKLNALGADGWEIDHITATPLTTGWISPRGGTAAAGLTDKVHYLAMLGGSCRESSLGSLRLVIASVAADRRPPF